MTVKPTFTPSATRSLSAAFTMAVVTLAFSLWAAPAHAAVECNGVAATIVGNGNAQTLTGTPGVDVIAALGGNDTVYGLGGDDKICGGTGNDRLYGGADPDDLFGEQGNDMLDGGAAPDRLFGDMYLTGPTSPVTVKPGKDILRGGEEGVIPASDQMVGDHYVIGQDTTKGAPDILISGEGGCDCYGDNAANGAKGVGGSRDKIFITGGGVVTGDSAGVAGAVGGGRDLIRAYGTGGVQIVGDSRALGLPGNQAVGAGRDDIKVFDPSGLVVGDSLGQSGGTKGAARDRIVLQAGGQVYADSFAVGAGSKAIGSAPDYVSTGGDSVTAFLDSASSSGQVEGKGANDVLRQAAGSGGGQFFADPWGNTTETVVGTGSDKILRPENTGPATVILDAYNGGSGATRGGGDDVSTQGGGILQAWADGYSSGAGATRGAGKDSISGADNAVIFGDGFSNQGSAFGGAADRLSVRQLGAIYADCAAGGTGQARCGGNDVIKIWGPLDSSSVFGDAYTAGAGKATGFGDDRVTLAGGGVAFADAYSASGSSRGGGDDRIRFGPSALSVALYADGVGTTGSSGAGRDRVTTSRAGGITAYMDPFASSGPATGSAPDIVTTGSGADNIFADSVSGTGTASGKAADIIRTGPGNDVLFGDHLAATPVGGGKDKLYAGAGLDTLYGGPLFDLCDGGADSPDTAINCEKLLNIP